MTEGRRTVGERYRVIEDPRLGYRRLDPVPDTDELAEFYESRYYDLVRKGGRGCDLARFLAGGDEAERERSWLRRSLYADLRHILGEYAPGRRVLDIGCGTGDLLAFLVASGFEGEGTEPSVQAAAVARSQGLNVHGLSFERFLDEREASGSPAAFDAVMLLNVLEHIPEPADLLQHVRRVLGPRGIVCVRVPNDFNELQRIAVNSLGLAPYWIAVPDHINYFDYASLDRLLRHVRFQAVYAQADFPMEVFLLMGDDYVTDPEVGARCHARRRTLEEAMPEDVRRRLYAALAREGLGRNCLIVGRRE